jgi:hypothetical protein
MMRGYPKVTTELSPAVSDPCPSSIFNSITMPYYHIITYSQVVGCHPSDFKTNSSAFLCLQ